MVMTRPRAKRHEAPPVYTFHAVPGIPRIRVLRLRGETSPEMLPGPHSHDYLALAYFERDGGWVRSGRRGWDLREGDAFVSSPGEVQDARGLVAAHGWVVFFPPEVLAPEASRPFLAWRSHPLLFPFVGGRGERAAQHLIVPPSDRPSWSARLSALESELNERRDGYGEAALAHLTLVLVDVARLAADVVGELRLNDEPLLADVFGFIEERYRERVSLRDVARAVSLSPGHLTTAVRRKTGRTVQEWIIERRMAEARRLLVGTDLSTEEVGWRVGFRDAAYFVRSFRRLHSETPLAWRRAGRSHG